MTPSLFSLAELRERVTARGQEGVPVIPSMDVALVLIDIAEQARDVLESLDTARAWNAERGRKTAVKDIDFAIGATLRLRDPLRNVS